MKNTIFTVFCWKIFRVVTIKEINLTKKKNKKKQKNKESEE